MVVLFHFLDFYENKSIVISSSSNGGKSLSLSMFHLYPNTSLISKTANKIKLL